MCYGDDMPSAEDSAREIRAMRRALAAVVVVAAGLAAVVVYGIWRMS